MNERVRDARKSLKLNQADFAKRLGVTAAAISKIESGERGLTEQMILSICREFNIHEHWLRTGEGGSDAMFEEYDDTNIAALVSEYGLDRLSQIVLQTYVNIPADKREGVNAFISHLARVVMEENVSQLKNSILNEVEHSDPKKELKDSVDSMTLQTQTIPRLKSSIDNEDTEMADETTTVHTLSIEERADEFAATAREQFILEQKKGSKASFVKESGAV